MLRDLRVQHHHVPSTAREAQPKEKIMPSTPQDAVLVKDLSHLKRGDTIEARRFDTVLFTGEVELVSPRLGVLWIRHGSWQNRKLLDSTEYHFWKR